MMDSCNVVNGRNYRGHLVLYFPIGLIKTIAKELDKYRVLVFIPNC